MIYHVDQGTLNKFEVTKQGFIRLFGTVAEEGYLEYVQPNGTIEKEYVPEETLFSKEHLDSIATAAITLFHPPRATYVTPSTYRIYNVGHTVGVVPEKDKKVVDTELQICREDALQAIDNGLTSLSMGYVAERRQIAQNDFVQTRRICNHIAIVKKGRASGAKIHLDSIDEPIKIDYRLEEYCKAKKFIKIIGVNL